MRIRVAQVLLWMQALMISALAPLAPAKLARRTAAVAAQVRPGTDMRDIIFGFISGPHGGSAGRSPDVTEKSRQVASKGWARPQMGVERRPVSALAWGVT